MRNDLRDIVDYFCGTTTILPRELCLLILEISGNLRVGKRSISYVTSHLPAFRGKIWNGVNPPPFDKRLYFLRKDHTPFVIFSHRKK